MRLKGSDNDLHFELNRRVAVDGRPDISNRSQDSCAGSPFRGADERALAGLPRGGVGFLVLDGAVGLHGGMEDVTSLLLMLKRVRCVTGRQAKLAYTDCCRELIQKAIEMRFCPSYKGERGIVVRAGILCRRSLRHGEFAVRGFMAWVQGSPAPLTRDGMARRGTSSGGTSGRAPRPAPREQRQKGVLRDPTAPR